MACFSALAVVALKAAWCVAAASTKAPFRSESQLVIKSVCLKKSCVSNFQPVALQELNHALMTNWWFKLITSYCTHVCKCVYWTRMRLLLLTIAQVYGMPLNIPLQPLRDGLPTHLKDLCAHVPAWLRRHSKDRPDEKQRRAFRKQVAIQQRDPEKRWLMLPSKGWGVKIEQKGGDHLS